MQSESAATHRECGASVRWDAERSCWWCDACGRQVLPRAIEQSEPTTNAIHDRALEIIRDGYAEPEDVDVVDLARAYLELRRTTYPATPVDCLLSDLQGMFFPVLSKTSVLTLAAFDKRVAEFNREIA